VRVIERLGEAVIEGVVVLGNFVLFLLSALRYMLTPPYKPRLLIRQLRTIGAESFFLVGLIGLFTGMVLGLQGYNTLRRFGSEGELGTVVALVLVRELGPVLAALMVTARAGSAMAAELGAMQATEPADALTVMALNPVQYLVSPRVLAGVTSLPLLTCMLDVLGIGGGCAVGVGGGGRERPRGLGGGADAQGDVGVAGDVTAILRDDSAAVLFKAMPVGLWFVRAKIIKS